MQVKKPSDGGIEVFYRIWKRRKWLAVGVVTFCFITAVSFVLALPSIYRATATVLLDGRTAPGNAASLGQENGGSQLDPVTEEVLSRDRLARLIVRFNLYAGLRGELSQEALITRMRRDILIDRKTSDDPTGRIPIFALDVSFQGTDPTIVGDVTNALVSSFVNENNSIRSDEAATNVTSLQNQLTAIKQKLDSQSGRINAFRESHIGELPEQQTANLATLQQLSVQLQQNSASEIQAMTRRENLLKQMTDSGDASLDQLEQELASLRTRYTDKYPDVVRVETQIAVMKRQQAAQGAADPHKPVSPSQQQFQTLESELNSYREADGRLRAEIADYQRRVENVPLRAQQLQALSQGYDETQEVYSTLLKQYEQAKLGQDSAATAGNQYRVLDPALPPKEASGPARTRLIAMALVLSIALAVAAVLAAEKLNVSFHSVDELRAFTTLPVLASVPQIITGGDAWKSRLRSGFVTVAVIGVTLFAAELTRILGHGSSRLVWMLARHG